MQYTSSKNYFAFTSLAELLREAVHFRLCTLQYIFLIVILGRTLCGPRFFSGEKRYNIAYFYF